MGRNKSFFSLLGLWETFLSLGDSADALGGFGKLWGSFGRLWEALRRLWGGFGKLWGAFGEALGMPAARRRTKLYTKMLGVRKLPINQLCLQNVSSSRSSSSSSSSLREFALLTNVILERGA